MSRLLSMGHGGQILLSEVAYHLVRDNVSAGLTVRDLGVYRMKDLAREERVYQVVAAGLPVEFPALRSLDLRPHDLPVQLTSFVGRELEVGEVKALMSRSRLVTLTGIGGAGKTRLGLQVAAELVEASPDGAWFVDLSATTDEGMVARAIAAALRVRPEPARTIEDTLVAELQGRQLLLVLDNCEQVVEACSDLVTRLLTGTERLRILATSREALRVPGEVVQTVPPMTVPEPGPAGPVDHQLLDRYEAVRLFMDRARAVQPAFAVTRANAPAIAALCVRLEGIPLAIELAAARAATLSVEQILARLDERFRILSHGPRTAPRRQQTLEATIAWSHDLLGELERVLFRRLAVFRGGWTLEAAEAVCAGDGVAGLEPEDVLDLLGRLVDQSLTVVEDGLPGQVRYRMLETVHVAASAENQLAALGVTLPESLRDSLRAAEDTCRANLGDAAFDAAWAEGHEMSLDASVTYASQTASDDG